ncbi:MAG: hypothetical protein GX220_02895 [Treponema sp.]|jgi:hypothetical protein|nr:hypothetical protein [Treponema sp.]
MTFSFSKISFSQPETLIKTWNPDNDTEVSLKSDGSFTFTGDNGNFSGTWSATTNIFRMITLNNNGNAGYNEMLFNYKIVEEEIVLTWTGESEPVTYNSFQGT